VALTRAKHKLVMVGDPDTLSKVQLLCRLLAHLHDTQALTHLPSSCLDGLDGLP
jgi:superfamily I DNA and/or RNA helicase